MSDGRPYHRAQSLHYDILNNRGIYVRTCSVFWKRAYGVSDVFNRATRKGDYEELDIPDWQCVREALGAKDLDRAKAYATTLHHLYEGMILQGTEWNLSWVETLSKNVPIADERRTTLEVCDEIQRIALNARDLATHPEVNECASFYNPENLKPGEVEIYRKNWLEGKPNAAHSILKPAHETFGKMRAALEKKDFHEAREHFDIYAEQMRVRHDFMIQFIASYPMAIARNFGQTLAEKVLHDSFATGIFYEAVWTIVVKMSPSQAAAFLAEHVRAHFSGPNRDGKVTIVEEHDRYRLVFDPCGSGQAMRLRAQELSKDGAGTLPEATAHTWFMKSKVPAYCSHCAVNELEGMRRLGYPIFTVEFDPDPKKPCGWTIYKDPDLIPESYFKRIGFKKDSSKFKRLQPEP